MRRIEETGWLSGMRNMIQLELGRWKPRRLLTGLAVQTLINMGMLMLYLNVILMEDPGDLSAEVFLSLFTFMVAAISSAVILQNEVVKEKESGTAAWILSGPVTRDAFILAKLVVNAPIVLLLTVVSQWLLGRLIIAAYGLPVVDAVQFSAFIGIHLLHTLLWITLTICLGCVFKTRGPVIGIPILIASFESIFSGILSRVHPDLPLILPEATMKIAQGIFEGETPGSLVPLVACAAWCLVFVAVGLWRFRQEEF